MFKEILTEEIKFVVYIPDLDTKTKKEYANLGKKFNVTFDSTWDSSNPNEYKILGKKSDIEKFLKKISVEY